MILISTPIIYTYSTYGLANLPVTTYLVLGTLWSIDGLISGRRETLITGGLLLALQDGLDRRELATRIVNVRYTGQVANQDNYYA